MINIKQGLCFLVAGVLLFPLLWKLLDYLNRDEDDEK